MGKRILAALAATVLLSGPALADRAGSEGKIVCQNSLSEFATDAAEAKSQLSDSQLKRARDLVDVGRSQCMSSPGIVEANIRALRQDLRLQSGPQSAGIAAGRFDSFYPADDDELSELTR